MRKEGQVPERKKKIFWFCSNPFSVKIMPPPLRHQSPVGGRAQCDNMAWQQVIHRHDNGDAPEAGAEASKSVRIIKMFSLIKKTPLPGFIVSPLFQCTFEFRCFLCFFFKRDLFLPRLDCLHGCLCTGTGSLRVSVDTPAYQKNHLRAIDVHYIGNEAGVKPS